MLLFCNPKWNDGSRQWSSMTAKAIRWKVGSNWQYLTLWSILTSHKVNTNLCWWLRYTGMWLVLIISEEKVGHQKELYPSSWDWFGLRWWELEWDQGSDGWQSPCNDRISMIVKQRKVKFNWSFWSEWLKSWGYYFLK